MDIWKHGKYIDTWSMVHFLSGLLLGSFLFRFELGLWQAFGGAVAILLMWEGFEALVRIIEPSENVVLDLVIGILGVELALYAHFKLGYEFSPGAFALGLLLAIFMSVWGFRDYLKRGYR